MTRLSLLMGLFMAVTVTGIVMLLAVMGNVNAGTMIYRGCVIFFIFGALGTVLGSFLEVLLLPSTTETETEKLKLELMIEDSELQAELGDLLDDDKNSTHRSENYGTPTDGAWQNGQANSYSTKMASQSNSAAAS
ncbi:MAG TPA: hypothetical protein DCG57_21680 [Candidatus Riflebacteria bacterium]|nr:MAG: hypothetical protein CVV41_03135 [Candidatus Riflebacteria bacterium HGW-Riflebacteria-1]HAE41218.1 hypothetical protein [Candidatus Riflebacteria bacterium]